MIKRRPESHYRYRNTIACASRAARVAATFYFSVHVRNLPGMPSPLLGSHAGGALDAAGVVAAGSGGSDMLQTIRVLTFRGGVPFFWIACFTWPLPYSYQARAARGRAAHARALRAASRPRLPLPPVRAAAAVPLTAPNTACSS